MNWQEKLLIGSLVLSAMAAPAPADARDRGADGNFSERRSRHFVLLQDVAIDRYSGIGGSRKFERDVLTVLEHAHDDVRDVLGIQPSADTRVLIYDAGVYDSQFASLFGFRSAGFFDGVVHVRGGTVVDGRLARTLHHEYLHAALDAVAPRDAFPAWLNEGLAEYFERAFGQRRLTGGERAYLQQRIQAGEWIGFAQLSGPSFAGLDTPTASQAYLQSFAMIEFLARLHGEDRLARLCERVSRGSAAGRAIRRTYRSDLVELEQALLEELR